MIEIKGRARFEGEFLLPGDKSITHRAVMFNRARRGRR